MNEDFYLPDFDTEDDSVDSQGPPHDEDIEFAHPPQMEPPDTAPLDMETITELLTEALNPLESAITDLAKAHTEGMQAREQATKYLIETVNQNKGSIIEALNETDQGGYNISDIQISDAMSQPDDDLILPGYVTDEIDRLYTIEKAYDIAKLAEQALEYLLNQDRIILKISDDPDEQLMFMTMMAQWHTKAHPDLPPRFK